MSWLRPRPWTRRELCIALLSSLGALAAFAFWSTSREGALVGVLLGPLLLLRAWLDEDLLDRRPFLTGFALAALLLLGLAVLLPNAVVLESRLRGMDTQTAWARVRALAHLIRRPALALPLVFWTTALCGFPALLHLIENRRRGFGLLEGQLRWAAAGSYLAYLGAGTLLLIGLSGGRLPAPKAFVLVNPLFFLIGASAGTAAGAVVYVIAEGLSERLLGPEDDKESSEDA